MNFAICYNTPLQSLKIKILTVLRPKTYVLRSKTFVLRCFVCRKIQNTDYSVITCYIVGTKIKILLFQSFFKFFRMNRVRKHDLAKNRVGREQNWHVSITVVNFINILFAHFFVHKCFAQFSLAMFQLCNFWHQNIGAKCACKMLMKSTLVK